MSKISVQPAITSHGLRLRTAVHARWAPLPGQIASQLDHRNRNNSEHSILGRHRSADDEGSGNRNSQPPNMSLIHSAVQGFHTRLDISVSNRMCPKDGVTYELVG